MVRVTPKQPSAPEVIENRPLPMVGLLPLLSDKQKKLALNVSESETTGDPKFLISA